MPALPRLPCRRPASRLSPARPSTLSLRSKMDAAVGEEKNPVEVGEEKNPVGEEKEVDMSLAEDEDKIPSGQITTFASMLDGKDQQQAASEKMQLGGLEKKQLCGSKQTDSLAVTEENDESKNVQLQNKKLKKKRRSELVKIKKEKESCDTDKTQVLVDAEEPASEPSFLSTWSASYYTKIYQDEKPLYKGSILDEVQTFY